MNIRYARITFATLRDILCPHVGYVVCLRARWNTFTHLRLRCVGYVTFAVDCYGLTLLFTHVADFAIADFGFTRTPARLRLQLVTHRTAACRYARYTPLRVGLVTPFGLPTFITLIAFTRCLVAVD